ncbi:Glycerol-3-phosphate dehydrogenase [Hortaea werneckii]|nr:Glycerol-3-phosphate dehydrogenase [Hortaea werneckii]
MNPSTPSISSKSLGSITAHPERTSRQDRMRCFSSLPCGCDRTPMRERWVSSTRSRTPRNRKLVQGVEIEPSHLVNGGKGRRSRRKKRPQEGERREGRLSFHGYRLPFLSIIKGGEQGNLYLRASLYLSRNHASHIINISHIPLGSKTTEASLILLLNQIRDILRLILALQNIINRPLTSYAVPVPWSCCPLSSRFSISLIGFPSAADIFAQRKLRPEPQDVIMSATPQDSSVKDSARTAVDPAGSQRDDVLQGAAERDARDVRDDADVEVGAVEELLHVAGVQGGILGGQGLEVLDLAAGVLDALGDEVGEVDVRGLGGAAGGSAGGGGGRGVLGVHRRRVVGYRCLRPLLQGHLGGDVGSAQRAALAAGLGHIDTLHAANAAGEGHDVAPEGIAGLGDELVGQVEDEDGGALDGVEQVRVGDDVVGQGDVGQVLDVLMEGVDEGGELLGLAGELVAGVVVLAGLGDLVLLLEHPHLHLLFEDIIVLLAVLGHDLGDGLGGERGHGCEGSSGMVMSDGQGSWRMETGSSSGEDDCDSRRSDEVEGGQKEKALNCE